MIQTATPESFENYTPRSEAGVRILSLVQAYGVEQSFLRFWRGEYGSAISLMDGHAVIELQQEERDELFIFLTMQPEVRSVRTDEENARLLAALWPRSRLETGAVLTLRDRIVPTGPADLTSSPREIYPILQTGFGETLPAFDAWYADVSHRMRHGVCRAAVVREMGQAGRLRDDGGAGAGRCRSRRGRDPARTIAPEDMPPPVSPHWRLSSRGRGGGSISVQKTKGRAVFMNGSAFRSAAAGGSCGGIPPRPRNRTAET